MAVSTQTNNVLFLCTGNSARSLMAEAYLNSLSGSAFRAFSAGSYPTGVPNVFALETLQGNKIPTDGLRSKSWEEFGVAGAPVMTFIFTVCDNAAGEACPIWLGHPVSAHWPFPDPAAHDGSDAEKRAHFLDVFQKIRARIDMLVRLAVEDLDEGELLTELIRIGTIHPPTDGLNDA